MPNGNAKGMMKRIHLMVLVLVYKLVMLNLGGSIKKVPKFLNAMNSQTI